MSEEYKAPLRAGEASAMQFLFGLVSEMERGKEQLRKRIDATGRMRQYKRICTELSNLVEALLMTIPPEKLYVLRRNLYSQEMKIHTKAPADKDYDNFTYVPTPDLYDLCAFAARWECKVCDGDGQCMKDCKYRHTLKRVLMIDVDESNGVCMGKKINWDEEDEKGA